MSEKQEVIYDEVDPFNQAPQQPFFQPRQGPNQQQLPPNNIFNPSRNLPINTLDPNRKFSPQQQRPQQFYHHQRQQPQNFDRMFQSMAVGDSGHLPMRSNSGGGSPFVSMAGDAYNRYQQGPQLFQQRPGTKFDMA